MYSVSTRFHEIVKNSACRTRARLYFIGDEVDCTDDNDVQTNGVLLKLNDADTDSNKRIDMEGGVKLSELFEKGNDWEIGTTVSSYVSVSFLNDSAGGLTNFGFGRCKIYLDAYDTLAHDWIACPLGVFLFDTPMQWNGNTVRSLAYDQMQMLDASADDWWNSLDFSGGLTLAQILTSLASATGVKVKPSTLTGMVNSTVTYTAAPFVSAQRTYRDILGYIAGASAAVGRFDRDGYLELKWFTDADIDDERYIVDATRVDTVCMGYMTAEYAVAAINKLQVSAADNDIGVIVGTGTNAYQIVDNKLITGETEADIQAIAIPIYNAISALSFTPTSLKTVSDWSIESGDVIDFKRGSNTFTVPIFQQELDWHGGSVRASLWSSGEAKRLYLTAQNRTTLRDLRRMHQFDVTLDALLSRIETIDGRYSELRQTVDGITRTVSGPNGLVQAVFNTDGELWTAIKTNSTNLSDLEDQINADISARQSFIRINPSEPSIVLGFADGSIVKLKLVNNVIFMYNGSDADTFDEANPFAYFKPDETYNERVIAGTSVQIGKSSESHILIAKDGSNGVYIDRL